MSDAGVAKTDVPASFDAGAADREDPRFTEWLREGAAAPGRRRKRPDRRFCRTAELEVAFFDDAYRPAGPSPGDRR